MTAFYRSACAYGAGHAVSGDGRSSASRTILPKPRGGAELVIMTYFDGNHPPAGSTVNVFNTVDLDACEACVLDVGGLIVEAISELAFNGNTMRMGI